jgi:putative FmdB family regulatory protein
MRVVPTYEFRCRTCETRFEVKRPIAESDAPAACPDGHADTVRLLSMFAAVTGGSAPSRSASRSVESSAPPAGGCGAGCACAS